MRSHHTLVVATIPIVALAAHCERVAQADGEAGADVEVEADAGGDTDVGVEGGSTSADDAGAAPTAPDAAYYVPDAPVFASPPPVDTVTETPAPVATKVESHWYGWQILLVEGTTVGLAVATQEGAILWGWLFWSPVVHFAHLRPGAALGSLGLRVGLPVIGALAGCALDNNGSSEFGCLGGAAVGALVGLVTAEVLDLSLLANEEVPVDEKKEASFVTPTATIVHGGWQLGVYGAF